MLAHQGGWDELMFAAGLVLAMLGLSMYRRRRAKTPPREAANDICAYCGAPLEPDEIRCSSCGFRRGEAAG